MTIVRKTDSRRRMLKGTLAVAAAPALITAASAQEKVRWKLQSHWPKGSASFTGSLGPIVKGLEARSDGRFTIELLGAGEIAKGTEIFNVVRRGVVQMGSTSPTYNLGESELQALYMGMPGTLRDPWELAHLTKNMGLEDAINELLRPKGVFYMADKAYPTELILKKEIEPGADLAGIKLRSAGILLEMFGLAGFAPQHVDGPELYQAVATGVVDGAHWGAAQGGLSMRLWEVAKVHMRPAVAIINDVYLINLAAYEKLPADLQLIFTDLMNERYFARSVEYKYLEAVAMETGITKFGVTVKHFPDDVLKKMADASRKLVAKEAEKGPKAKEYVEKMTDFMKVLGYV